MEISNYDVLLEDISSCPSSENTHHIGNKRFEVFLNLHQESYNAAEAGNNFEDMDEIVERVVDIVCNKCVPQGRFLQRINGEWIEIVDHGEVKLRIHAAFLASVSPQAGRFIFTTDNVFQLDMIESSEKSTEGKRRRRGSFAKLRRSIRESMVLRSSNGLGGEKGAPDANAMDVILVPNGIDPSNNPGNARFRMLVNLQKEIFSTSDDEEKQEVLDDLINTVQNHWKGRFLLKSPDGCNPIQDSGLRLALTNVLTPPPNKTMPVASGTQQGEQPFSWKNTPLASPKPLASNKSKDLSNVQSLHSAAIERLKKTQKKRQIMSRVERGPKKAHSAPLRADMTDGMQLLAMAGSAVN